jgi:hypothetical protein
LQVLPFRNPVTIVTKNYPVTRDPTFAELRRSGCVCESSITTPMQDSPGGFEPGIASRSST